AAAKSGVMLLRTSPGLDETRLEPARRAEPIEEDRDDVAFTGRRRGGDALGADRVRSRADPAAERLSGRPQRLIRLDAPPCRGISEVEHLGQLEVERVEIARQEVLERQTLAARRARPLGSDRRLAESEVDRR